jgi:WD40 repeat protein
LHLAGWILPSESGTQRQGTSFPLLKFAVPQLTKHSKCIALLQGHTALVSQLQLSPTILATGGSDGRVITFCLSTFDILHRIAAHDSSVTSLQFDTRFLVTGGNDGRVRLFETKTGNFVRDLSERSDNVWKVVYRGDLCVVMCRRATRTVTEIWSFWLRPDREVVCLSNDEKTAV